MEVVRYLDPELPSVRLDRETFRSAILNLLLNAVQAMEAGASWWFAPERPASAFWWS